MTFADTFLLRNGNHRFYPTLLRKARQNILKENIASIAVIVGGVLTLLGVLSKSITDYFVGIRATRTSVLMGQDKANADRTTLLETYVERNRVNLDALERRCTESDRALNSALTKIERLETANTLLIEQNTRLQEENKELPILRKQVIELQRRCAELEVSVTKNREAIDHSGSMND